MIAMESGTDVYAFLAALDRSQEFGRLVEASGFFDPSWYRDRYMRGIDRDPLDYFVDVGVTLDHDPSQRFSCAQYYDHYTDVKTAGVPAFRHFLMDGSVERRLYFPFADGDYADLRARLPDLSDVARRERTAGVAVVIHVYYPDLWEELESQLANMPEPFDLFVSLVQGRSDQLQTRLLADHPGACLRIFPNHGRDVFPFMQFLDAGAFDGYELLCKLHTKKSLHRDDGAYWRQTLYSEILGSRRNAEHVLRAFRRDDALGIFVPDGHRETYMGVNESLVRELLGRIDIPLDVTSIVFPAGNMFWIRASCLAPLKKLGIGYTDYPFEAGQVDGTVGHALERVIGAVCTSMGKRILTTSDIASA